MRHEFEPIDLSDLEVEPPAPQYLRAIILVAVTVVTLVVLFFCIFPTGTTGVTRGDLGFALPLANAGALDPVASSTLGHDVRWTDITPVGTPKSGLTDVTYFKSFVSTSNVCDAEIIQGALPAAIIPSGNDLFNTESFLNPPNQTKNKTPSTTYKTGYYLSLAPPTAGHHVAVVVFAHPDAIAIVRVFGSNHTVVEATVSCTSGSPEARALRSDALQHMIITLKNG